MGRRAAKLAGFIALLLLAVFVPFFANDYQTDLASVALVYALFAISLDLAWGFTGILSLGHAAFFGLGAYTYGLIGVTFNFGGIVFLAWAASALLPMILALVVGYASSRAGTGDVYFALISLAVTLILERVAFAWRPFTGGSDGLLNVPWPSIAFPGSEWYFDFDTPFAFYFLTLGFTVAGYLFARRLVASPFGRVLVAIRENRSRTEFLGFNVTRYRVTAYVISAGLGGIAGAISAPVRAGQIVAPEVFGVLLSVQVFIWVAVGGAGTLIGPAIAAIGLKFFESFLTGHFLETYLIIIGAVFVLIVLFFPDGLAGYLIQRWGVGYSGVGPAILKNGPGGSVPPAPDEARP
ncbi:MAG: branched-chain amino acid ABC transporter permease [Nitrospinota bacterium]